MTAPHATAVPTALQRLVDHHDVSHLVHRLGACLDEHRFGDLSDVLTEDVTAATPGGSAAGIDAVVAQATRNHAAFDGLQHCLTNVLVELDGDGAVVRANALATFAGGAGRPVRALAAVYRLRARRTPSGWRVRSIEVRPVWRVDVP